MYRYAFSVKGDDVLLPSWKAAAAAAELRRIELSFSTIADSENARRMLDILLELKQTSGLEVASFHIPFWPGDRWPYTSSVEDERKRVVAEAMEFVRSFGELGFSNLTIHSGGEPNLPEQRGHKIAQMQKTISEMMPLLEQLHCSLNVEFLPRTCIGNSESELLEIVEPFPAEYVNICFDVNHAMDRNDELPSMIRACSQRIRTFHISDYDGIDEQHWFVGQGCIRWSGVMDVIREIPHDTLLIFENNMLRSMRPNPDYWFRHAKNQIVYLENAAAMEQIRAETVIE